MRATSYRLSVIACCLLALASPLSAATEPAFDCSKAAGQVEQLVCRDEQLAALDRKLAAVYQAAMDNLPGAQHGVTRAMQRGWIKGRNDCWKAEDVRSCVEYAYQGRIVELQISGGLLVAPDYIGFSCEGDAGKPFTAVYYNQTEPPSAVLTWGDDQVIAFSQRTGSGTRYSGPNVDFREHQGAVTVDWYGTRLHCVSQAGRSGAVPADPLSLHALQNAAYQGLADMTGSITLQQGRWEGEPYQPGGATLPVAEMLGELLAHGDLDADGVAEAVVLINYAPGGSAQLLHLAVVRAEGGVAVNVATALVADRPRVRNLSIHSGEVVLDLVQAGAGDPACCPGDVVTRRWVFDGRQLTEQQSAASATRLSPDVLQGQTWRLASWRHGEPVETATGITLAYTAGKFSGSAGCNRYFASVTAGALPGDIAVGPAGTTRMACADPAVAAAEQRFLDLLQQVQQFSWYAGQLTLSYGQGSAAGVMFLEAMPAEESPRP